MPDFSQSEIPTPPINPFLSTRSSPKQSFTQDFIEKKEMPVAEPVPEMPVPEIELPSRIIEEPFKREMNREMNTSKPIFVNFNKYRSVLKEISSIREFVAVANNSMANLNSLKTAEDSELDEWRLRLEDIERKLVYMDEVLFGKL